MSRVGETADDGRVQWRWLLLGHMARALPELRRFPEEEAERIWARAVGRGRGDPRVRWGWIAAWIVVGVVCVGALVASLNGRRNLLAHVMFVFLCAMFISLVGVATRLLTLYRMRWHLRLEIGTLCPACGYDLGGGHLDLRTGLADAQTGLFQCPECGMALRRVSRAVAAKWAEGAGP
jgi:hypothetical protein